MFATSHVRNIPAILFFIIMCYGFYAAHRLFTGPSIIVLAPEPGRTLTDPLTVVRGTVHSANRVLLNGRPITTDPTGMFEEKIVTPTGYGIVLVEAQNRFGRYTANRIELYGNPSLSRVSINQ